MRSVWERRTLGAGTRSERRTAGRGPGLRRWRRTGSRTEQAKTGRLRSNPMGRRGGSCRLNNLESKKMSGTYLIEPIAGLGFVEAAKKMNDRMAAAAASYNSGTGRSYFSVKSGAPFGQGSQDMARAVYGLQMSMYDNCRTVDESTPISMGLDASCANVDGKLGPDTKAAINRLPEPNGPYKVANLLALSRGEEVPRLSTQDMANAASTLGIGEPIRTKQVVPGEPDPPGTPSTTDSSNTWLIAAGAVAIGVAFWMLVRKKGK